MIGDQPLDSLAGSGVSSSTRECCATLQWCWDHTLLDLGMGATLLYRAGRYAM